MDLAFTAEELAFRDEARRFFRSEIPQSIRDKVAEGEGLTRDDMITSQRILNARGWATVNWPVQWGGQDWSPVQVYLYQDEMQQANVPTPIGFNVTMVGPGDRAVRQRRAEAAVPAEDRQCRHLLVPGLFRTWLRFRSCVAAHAGRAQGRQVRHQRPEDLDHAGAIRRLDLLPRAHRSCGEEAGRHFVHSGGHEDARHHRAARSSPSTAAAR